MKTFVCGHRNPDVDSVMSAYALAELRRRTGTRDVEAICAGLLPEKARWVFDHFALKPLRAKRDVYVRVRDLMDATLPMIDAAQPLVEALKILEASGESSLPVRAADGAFAGMLSPAKLLSLFIANCTFASYSDLQLIDEYILALTSEISQRYKCEKLKTLYIQSKAKASAERRKARRV